MQTQGMSGYPDERRQMAGQAVDTLEDARGVGLAQRESRAVRRAMGLGWFSVALGLAEIVAPAAVAAIAGARIRPQTLSTLRLLGVRELVSGLGILSKTRPDVWLWSRVAGDAMDLALLGKTLASPKSEHARTMTSIASVLGVTALDVWSAIECSREERGLAEPDGIHVLSAITVNRPREEVYRYWRDLEHLPTFMAHLESVTMQENGRSKWVANGPMGLPIEWEAEIVADQPNENLAWRSCEGSDVPNQGSVRFLDAPGGRGTEVRVELAYDPPAGALGAAVAKLFGAEPAQGIAGDLRRFKQVIETGEVLHSDASIHKGMHPARPSRSSTPMSTSTSSTSATRNESTGSERSGSRQEGQVTR
ncbi:MAG TPA: SRPBCC family protein [Polyangiaceae bacterium]|nr:SRPBCC family protein [Polyangiaceae bacterium]